MNLSDPFFEEKLKLSEVFSLGEPEVAAQSLGVAIPESLKSAVSKRKYEFIAGRSCALKALKRAGFSGKFDISINPNRSPVWPNGFTGSIAHGEGMAWALVALTKTIRSIGIDVEKIIKPETAAEISSRILVPEELEPSKMHDLSFEQYLSLIFSAKESLYKCLSPLTGIYFGFEDAECIEIDRNSNLLTIELRKTLNTEFQKGFRISARFELNDKVQTLVSLYAE